MARILPFKRCIMPDLAALLMKATTIHFNQRETTALTYTASGMQIGK
jgi:hypothetical protein